MSEWLTSLRLRLRALFRRRQLEQDLESEIAFHLAMREDQLRTSGASDADVGARRSFGSVTRVREDLRNTWALAERQTVIGMVLAQGARLVAVGLVVDVLVSLALTRVVSSLLYQANPYDLLAFAVVPAVLVPAAFMACAIPAWRATRVDPIAALSAE